MPNCIRFIDVILRTYVIIGWKILLILQYEALVGLPPAHVQLV